MAKVEVEWVPEDARGRMISHWGTHDFAWWKKQARGKREMRPTTFIVVRCFDRAGKPAETVEFEDTALVKAKARAKAWVESGGMSAMVEGKVRIPYEGTYPVQTFGEFRPKEDQSVWVWDVRDDGMPYGRRGPYSDVDEAYRDARRFAEASGRDNVVTHGSDPEALSFEILKAYKGRSGEVFLTSDLARAGRRLGEYR